MRCKQGKACDWVFEAVASQLYRESSILHLLTLNPSLSFPPPYHLPTFNPSHSHHPIIYQHVIAHNPTILFVPILYSSLSFPPPYHLPTFNPSHSHHSIIYQHLIPKSISENHYSPLLNHKPSIQLFSNSCPRLSLLLTPPPQWGFGGGGLAVLSLHHKPYISVK